MGNIGFQKKTVVENKSVAKKDIKNLCKAQIKHFRKHLRPSMNEWMVQDYDEWYDQLQIVLEKDRKRGVITKETYQDWLAVASEFHVKLVSMIQNHEETEDYIHRLCNPISS